MGIRTVVALATAAAVACVATASPVLSTQAPRCSGVPNTIPVNTAPPVLTSTVPNGKLFSAGAGNDTFRVLHLYGLPYDMGFAQGQLVKELFPKMRSMFYGYVESALEKILPTLPKSLVDYIAKYGLEAGLDLVILWTKPYTAAKYLQEMQGLADGAGVTLNDVYRLNMFPELIRAACTVVGSNGASTPTGSLHQLRALDIDTGIPIKDWPQITVYHHPDGTAVANFGWAVLIGSLTGFSSTNIGIGEKVWENHLALDGVNGEPWMFILRDALSMASLDDAIAHMKNANRTCAIHVGIGNGVENEFRGITMAQKAFDVYNDTSISYAEHPVIPGVFYWDKHEQPTHSYCLSDLLKEQYGKLDAKTLALLVAPTSGTGDFHAATMDYATQTVFFANSRKTTVTTGPLNAYQRQWSAVDVAALFKVTQ